MTRPMLTEQIDFFLQVLASEKGYSAHTIRAYGHDLAEFAGYAAGKAGLSEEKAKRSLAIDDIDSLTVRGYLGLLHRKNEKVTIARKLSALRSFFRHLVRHRLTDEDPTAAILTPKHSRRMPSYLSVDDMFRLLDQTADDTVLGLRNRALFETLYGSGIRVSELTGLNVFDVDFSSGCLRVSGKGGRERIVPVGEKALNRIQTYRDRLFAQTGIGMAVDGPLFLNKNKGRLSFTFRGPDSGSIDSQVQPGGADFTPRDPAQFRHPHAGCGSGPAHGSGTAGPQEPVNHPEIHPCEH